MRVICHGQRARLRAAGDLPGLRRVDHAGRRRRPAPAVRGAARQARGRGAVRGGSQAVRCRAGRGGSGSSPRRSAPSGATSASACSAAIRWRAGALADDRAGAHRRAGAIVRAFQRLYADDWRRPRHPRPRRRLARGSVVASTTSAVVRAVVARAGRRWWWASGTSSDVTLADFAADLRAPDAVGRRRAGRSRPGAVSGDPGSAARSRLGGAARPACGAATASWPRRARALARLAARSPLRRGSEPPSWWTAGDRALAARAATPSGAPSTRAAATRCARCRRPRPWSVATRWRGCRWHASCDHPTRRAVGSARSRWSSRAAALDNPRRGRQPAADEELLR